MAHFIDVDTIEIGLTVHFSNLKINKEENTYLMPLTFCSKNSRMSTTHEDYVIADGMYQLAEQSLVRNYFLYKQLGRKVKVKKKS